MKPSQKPSYTLWINELRLKQPVSTTFAQFYNPVALIILVIVAKSATSKEFIVVPSKSNSFSKYITFIEKNNERVLKKIPIDWIFKELPQDGFESFFFLVEIEEAQTDPLELLQQLNQVHLALSPPFSNSLTDLILIENIHSFLKSIACRSLFLLKEKIPTSIEPLNITVSNDLISLDATIEPHL